MRGEGRYPWRRWRPENRALAIVILVFVAVCTPVPSYLFLHRASVLYINFGTNSQRTVNYVITVDGREVDSGSIDTGFAYQDTVPLSWWIDECQSHVVVGTSTGETWGTVTYPVTVTVCSGTPATVDLQF